GAVVEIQSSSRDVTERVRAEEALAHQALHDSLTGLPNRALLQDRVEQALLAARRHGTSLALLFADLDRFKEVNDTFGHPMGHADVAMYVAKRADTDCALYEPGADRYSPTVIELASDLRHSIERGELALHFQPVVDMRSRQVVAVEALCRWRHPERGMVPA